MLSARTEAQRIAQGSITVAALNAGSYLLSALTVSNDMKQDNQQIIAWLPPLASSLYVPQIPQQGRVRLLGGKLKQDGFYVAQWKFAYWTFGMVSTWRGFYSDVNVSQAVTIKTYDNTDTAIYLQCYLDPLFLPGESGEPAYGGWQNVVVNFVKGTIIT